MARLARMLCSLVACAALVAMDAWVRPTGLPPALARTPTEAADQTPAPGRLTRIAQGSIPMPDGARSAHASTLLAMPDQHPWTLLAMWFAGSREAAPDVGIAASHFERASQRWSPADIAVQRERAASELGHGISRLGNPVLWRDASGRIHAFVVATGLGGWAAARIVHLRQTESRGEVPDFATTNLSLAVVRVLPLSWFWNTSFLARTTPLPLEDGGMVLPVYFELGLSYPVALRFDAGGEFRGMVRISDSKHLMQPSLLPLSATHWLALLRNGGPERKIAVAQTEDAGLHWHDLPNLALDNPDSSVAALALAPQHLAAARFVLAHNARPHSRSVLDLSESANGHDWTLAHTLARGAAPDDEYSYPALAWADNSLWVSYTDQRTHIAWQRFRLQAAEPSAP